MIATGVAVAAMTAEEKLELCLNKYLKDIPMNDKQHILEMILNTVTETYPDEHKVDADMIANIINDEQTAYYVSGDDVFDILYDLGFYPDSEDEDYLIDFGDCDI